MKNLSISKALVFVLLFSTAPFYGSHAETSAEGGISTVDQQESLKDQGFVARIRDKAQRIVTAPVNYVFGDKDSYEKKMFYVVLGGAVLVVAGYSSYRYFYGNLVNQVKETEVKKLQEQPEMRVEKDEDARIAQQAKIEAQSEKDLKLYKSIVANRMNAQADYKKVELRLQALERDWNSSRKYEYANYTDTYGRNPYYEAELAYHKERAELSSKISDLGRKWSNFTVEEVQFERDHSYISRERFKEVEQWALGVFHRWGRVVIA